jgi:hypothetical protein
VSEFAPRVLVQDRLSHEFVGVDCEGLFVFVKDVRQAHQFLSREEACLCGLEMCEQGYSVLNFFVLEAGH